MVRFEEIIGYEKEKEELKRLSDAWKNPDKYRALDVEIPHTVLLYGVPGVGKTMMANALISESGLSFFICRKSAFDTRFVVRIEKTFSLAVENSPAIVLLDDMDKFADGDVRFDRNKEEFVAIQSCLERVKDEAVYTVATANTVSCFPDSLLRAERFGRQICMAPPEKEDVEAIVRHYLRDKKISREISVDLITEVLKGKTCAELKSVVNEAGLLAGYESCAEIGRPHLTDAILKVILNATKSPEETYAPYIAYHEAGHAIAAREILGRAVDLVTIRSANGRGGICLLHGKTCMLSYKNCLNEATVGLAGRAATRLRFGEVDTGCSEDVSHALGLLRTAVMSCCAEGFRFGYDNGKYDNRQAPDRLDRIDRKLYRMMDDCFKRATTVLRANRPLLDAIAEELLAKEVLLSDELERLFAKKFAAS